jgi:hypothetical protein
MSAPRPAPPAAPAPLREGAPPPKQDLAAPRAEERAKVEEARDEKAKGGVFRRIADAVRQAFSESPEPTADDETTAEAAPEGRTLSGRIVLAKAGRVVVEVTVSGDDVEIDYAIATADVLLSAETLSRRVSFAEASSTKRGRYAAGQVLRFTLDLPDTLDPSGIRAVTISLSGVTVVAQKD